MIHLSDLIQQISNGRCESGLESLVAFEMPPCAELCDFPWASSLVRLPYDRCWLEGNAPIIGYSSRTGDNFGQMTTQMGFVATQMADGVYFYAVARSPITKIWGRAIDFAFDYELQSWLGYYVATQEEFSERDSDYVRWVAAFVTLLNCNNIKRINVEPPRALNKARGRRGKMPLYSYWTLDIDLASSRSGSYLGGTHASPRLHLRRGHPRQLRAGKWCWVNPHVVGKKELGIVAKDYRLISPDQ